MWYLFNDSCVFYLVFSLFVDVLKCFFKDILYVLIYKWVSFFCVVVIFVENSGDFV